MKKHYRHENDCLNCGTELQGKFCHNCGQENLQIKESFGHMVNHAVSDYFHFDQQFFHTLKPLLLKPGKLTLEYMAGRRAQYLHPVKMYIFISLVYFLLIFKTNHEVVRVNDGKHVSKKEVAEKVKKELDKNGALSADQKKNIEKTVKNALPAEGVKISNDGSPVKITDSGDDKTDSTFAQYTASQNKLPVDERDGFWERFYNKSNYAYKEKYGAHAKEMFMEDVKHNAPKMMFVLLPLFALILKFTFWRNKKYYVEHMIYAIHLHCFFFLFSAIILIIQMILPESWSVVSNWLTAILCIYTLYYIYRSLRVVYNRRRWVTIRKMISMSFMYWIMVCICLVGLVTLVAAQAG
ncbi:DUF3667 domain-containing protein [Mucilaginibacter boryungensis]|uniref:DUF3667 domain-containing protein n=1 Tax=Mucilaginibacter boryungensis TaxID=768480 RepID=A0ABR9XGU6_9SPHI|nr:DUF3667 domain-containing protein [Mucilaginibacter boryungensis]MBE9666461.1 DUF3667 domain-containing protein [Mucilaginibacter boryungensis]